MRRDGLRIDAGEQRVQFAANFEVRDAALGKDAFQHAAPGAIHDVDGELEAGFLDQLQVDEVLDGRDVGRLEIGKRHAAALALQARRIQLALDRTHDRRRTRAAIAGLVFHAIPVEGIMAGGDHHAAGGAQVLHRIRERRRGRVVVGEPYGDARGGENFGDDLGRALRGKARVVADDQAFARVLMLVDVDGHRVANAPHVVEGEIVGDDAAPSVRSELNLGGQNASMRYLPGPST